MAGLISESMASQPNAAAKVFGCEADGRLHDIAAGTYDERSFCYDEDKTWTENMANGLPKRCRDLPPSERPWAPEDKWVTFLNHMLASPFGVAAGPLLSSQWIALAASRGYDCLTYKTIRSHYHPGHGLPNIVHLDVDQQLLVSGPACELPLYARGPTTTTTTTTTTSGKTGGPEPGAKGAGAGARVGAAAAAAAAAASDGGTGGGRLLAITNSFGMPSLGPEQLAEDLPAAAAVLRRGQMMVVSVTGTPGRPGLSFSEDLQQAARVALAGGATALEVNLSCPNVGSSHVALYQDAPAVESLLTGLKEAVRSYGGDGAEGGGAVGGAGVPVMIKVGAFEDTDGLRKMLTAAERAGAGAVAGINGLSRRVEVQGGAGRRPALGPDRPTSGVCGDPIRAAGLDFVRQARQVIASEALSMGLVGVGGVTQAGHVMEYLEAGADVVQAATGFMWRPHLGTDFQRLWEAAGYSVVRADGRGGHK